MKNIRKVINSPLDKKEIDESQLAAQKGLARAIPAQDAVTESGTQVGEIKLTQAIKDERLVRKVVRASARLADLITDDDRIRAKAVIREAMEANTRVYDGKAKALDIQPDHKTRLAAATLQLAYDEGTPVKRSVTITSDFRSAEDILEVMRQSPEATRAIRALSGMGIEIEADAETINTMTETVKSEHGSTE